jgi:hypothetical protein
MSTEERERKKSWNKGSTRQQIHIRIEKKQEVREMFFFSLPYQFCAQTLVQFYSMRLTTQKRRKAERQEENEKRSNN